VDEDEGSEDEPKLLEDGPAAGVGRVPAPPCSREVFTGLAYVRAPRADQEMVDCG
jgi:hypothetical protein